MGSILHTLDCGELGELDLVVEYDYQPPERMTRDYPGCGESITVTGCTLVGKDVDWLFGCVLQDSEDLMEKIHELETTEREADYADYLYQLKKDEAAHEPY